MFVAIARFPDVPAEREAEFRAWFAWSNQQLRDVEGLQGRRLLLATDGRYTALVEHSSAETFATMQATEVASRVRAKLAELLLAEPGATPYEVVIDLANSWPCCGNSAGHDGHRTTTLTLVGADDDALAAAGCCR